MRQRFRKPKLFPSMAGGCRLTRWTLRWIPWCLEFRRIAAANSPLLPKSQSRSGKKVAGRIRSNRILKLARLEFESEVPACFGYLAMVANQAANQSSLDLDRGRTPDAAYSGICVAKSGHSGPDAVCFRVKPLSGNRRNKGAFACLRRQKHTFWHSSEKTSKFLPRFPNRYICQTNNPLSNSRPSLRTTPKQVFCWRNNRCSRN